MRRSRDTLKVGDVVGHRFELLKTLGRGAFGSVWLVRDARNGKHCVLKLSDKDAPGAPFAQYQAHLHDLVEELAPLHIPTIDLPSEIGELDGFVYQLSEYHDQFSSLNEVLSVTGVLHPRDGLMILSHIAEAVGSLHAKGLIHADLKPANILVSGPGDRQVRLIDFGMVQPVEAEDAVLVFGTYLYMHPELAASTRDMDAKSTTAKIQLRAATVGPYIDIYALGVIALEVLTCSPLVPRPLSHASISAHLRERNPWLRAADDSTVGAVTSLVNQLLTVRPREDTEVAASAVALSRTIMSLLPESTPRAPDSRAVEAAASRSAEPLPEVTSAIYRIAHLGKLITRETAAFVLKSGTVEAIVDPKEDEHLLAEVSAVFQHAIQRARASWRLGVAMTITAFALLVSMIVSAITLSVITGESRWALIFGGVGVSTAIGTLLWRPYDRLFRATILTQQIEIIHVSTVAGFRGTQNVEVRVRVCREAVASLKSLFEPGDMQKRRK